MSHFVFLANAHLILNRFKILHLKYKNVWKVQDIKMLCMYFMYVLKTYIYLF